MGINLSNINSRINQTQSNILGFGKTNVQVASKRKNILEKKNTNKNFDQNDIVSFIDGVGDITLEQLQEGLELLESFPDLKDVETELEPNQKLKKEKQKRKKRNAKIWRFCRTSSYVMLGAGIVFFTGNLIAGNGFLPGVSVAATGVLQKQKQKFNL